MFRGFFGIFEFFAAAAVALGADEFGGLGEFGFRINLHTSRFTLQTSREAGSGQVDVGEEERHRAALGDLLGFGQVLLGEIVLAENEVVERGGQQAAGKVIHLPCGAEAVDGGGGDVRQVERRLRDRVRQDRPDQPNAGEGQVIEGDVEERIPGCSLFKHLVPATFDVGKAI